MSQTIGNYFGDTQLCVVCGLPYHLCECDPMRIIETQALMEEGHETNETNGDTTDEQNPIASMLRLRRISNALRLWLA